MIFLKPKKQVKKPEKHNKVISTQPRKIETREWTYGLCSCCEDCGECCCAFFCTLCYVCRVVNRANEGCSTILCCGLVPTRTKIRVQRKIKGSVPCDFCAFLFCAHLSLIQMGLEARDTSTII